MPKLTIDDIDLKGKRILVRVDFNVPLDENGIITDDYRIRSSLPTINKVLDSGGKLILMSHMGRPKGYDPKLKMTPVGLRLSEYLKREVKLAPDCIGEETEKMALELKPGEILLLENLRFHRGETKNDSDFSWQLAKLGDVYVNDAFGTAHRAHASTEGVTHHIAICAAGYLMQKEIEYLGKIISNPNRPLVAILGGAKVAGKIEIIQNLINMTDTILVGGGMSYTFLKAEGVEIGNSLLEADKLTLAVETLRKARQAGVDLFLPTDVVIAPEADPNATTTIVPITEIKIGLKGLDIGPETAKLFADKIKKAKTILWNGPMGVFEVPPFAAGTKTIVEALAEATTQGAVTVVGGGDSAAAVKKYKLEDKITHISTGGGASLEFLAGQILPGIEALNDK
ncbi:MAG: phosphoglycerate kinase [candidate division Zixibacteria bacterium]|nr:phosphoglycerate kinase [Candidatus Tariuqbacter arcticus]